MSSYPLISCISLTKHNRGKRTMPIDRISISFIPDRLTVLSICDKFNNKNTTSSCNYGVSYDGKIALITEEKNSTWFSKYSIDDERSCTIQCSCDITRFPFITKSCYDSLVDLCVDICIRHNKKRMVLLFGKENYLLKHNPKDSEMGLILHGNRGIKTIISEFVKDVNRKLNQCSECYIIEVTFKNKYNAKTLLKKLQEVGFNCNMKRGIENEQNKR